MLPTMLGDGKVKESSHKIHVPTPLRESRRTKTLQPSKALNSLEDNVCVTGHQMRERESSKRLFYEALCASAIIFTARNAKGQVVL